MLSISLLIGTCAAGLGCSKKPSLSERPPVTLWEAADKNAKQGKVWIHPSARRALLAAGVHCGDEAPIDRAAAADPGVWRELDRIERFDEVMVAGDWVETSALLGYLHEAPDFYPKLITPEGVLFRRGISDGRAWVAPRPDDIVPRDAAENHAEMLSRVAMILQSMGEGRAALRMIDAAEKAAPNDINVLVRRSILKLLRGQLSEALAGADMVLAIDGSHIGALQTKAQALSRAGAYSEAWQVAEELISVAPRSDVQSLALHAKLSNEARAFSREQESLERLIELYENDGADAAAYRVLLGQCYARQGLGRQAMEQFRILETRDDLPPESKQDVATAIKKLNQTGF